MLRAVLQGLQLSELDCPTNPGEDEDGKADKDHVLSVIWRKVLDGPRTSFAITSIE